MLVARQECIRESNSGIALAYIHFGPGKVLGGLYVSKEASHRLGAIDNALKEKGGRLSVILRNQAAVCSHRRLLVSKHPLVERD